ncbi:MAG: hypothetical protein ABJP45_12025 [Cyclobacteriaceae bacterium]
MRKLVLGGFLLSLLCSNGLQAQAIGGGGGGGAPAGGFNFLGGLATIQQKNSKSEMEGTFYLDDEWREGDVLLTNELLIEDYPLKFDLQYNMLEFKFGDDIKVCPAHRIAKFSWRGADTQLRQFVNCKDFEFNDDVRLTGFFEVLYDQEGSAKLLAKTNYDIAEPTYNVALDVGEKNSRIVKSDEYYLVVEKVAVPFTKSKAGNLALFQENEGNLKKYLKSNKLKFSKKEDLIQIVKYYDSLLAK